MKKILWLLTGGTISCISTEQGLSPAADKAQAEKMLEAVGTSADVECIPLMNIDSTNISCNDMKMIGETAHNGITKGFDGIVITHGTDTMAYTSAFLRHMLENAPVPVVITGSQRPFRAEGSDAPDNLKNAFLAACDTRFAGVHILFGSKVLWGDSAHKEYTQSDDAFISPNGYKAAFKDGAFYDVIPSISGNYRYNADFSENIALIKLTPLTRPAEIETAVRSGFTGIVLEGYGCGGIPEILLPAIKSASEKGVRFMLISQCFYEGISLDIYAVGAKAAACGIISGGKMTAEAAIAEMMFNIGK